MLMRFEWDETKAELNFRKHGVHFPEALEVFQDPDALEYFDQEHSLTEKRWFRLGLSSRRLLLVVYVERREETIRIIHARKAGPKYRRMYEEK